MGRNLNGRLMVIRDLALSLNKSWILAIIRVKYFDLASWFKLCLSGKNDHWLDLKKTLSVGKYDTPRARLKQECGGMVWLMKCQFRALINGGFGRRGARMYLLQVTSWQQQGRRRFRARRRNANDTRGWYPSPTFHRPSLTTWLHTLLILMNVFLADISWQFTKILLICSL